MKLILLESYEADLSNSGYNIQFGEELTEIQTNLYSVCKHSDTFLAHCSLEIVGLLCVACDVSPIAQVQVHVWTHEPGHCDSEIQAVPQEGC